MKNKIGIFVVIVLVFVLVNSVFVSAGWIWNEEDYSRSEIESMYIDNQGRLVIGNDKWENWRMDPESKNIEVNVDWGYLGALAGGWQELQYEGEDENVNYDTFVKIIDNNRNKHPDSLFADAPKTRTVTPVTEYTIQSSATVKDVADERKKREETLKASTELRNRAPSVATSASTSMTDATGKAKTYDYDGAVATLDTSITTLDTNIEAMKKARDDARNRNLAAEADALDKELKKLEAQRKKVAELRTQYTTRRAEEASVDAVASDDLADRNYYASRIQELDEELSRTSDTGLRRSLQKEKTEMERLKAQEDAIIQLYINQQKALAAGDVAAADRLGATIDSRRKEYLASKSRTEEINKVRADVVNAMNEDHGEGDNWMRDELQALKDKGKDRDLKALNDLMKKRELRQEAKDTYGIDIEGKNYDAIKREYDRRKKIEQEALAAGLTPADLRLVRAKASMNPDWDSTDYEKASYDVLAMKYGVDRTKTPDQIKKDVKARQQWIETYAGQMEALGADGAAARAALLAKAKAEPDQAKFQTAAADLVEKEKVKQDIDKFEAAIDASGLTPQEKTDLKKKLDAARAAGTGAEARTLFDQQRVEILGGLNPAEAQKISTAYAGALAPPKAAPGPAAAPKGYLEQLDEKIAEELKKPMPDYAEVAKLRKEKEDFQKDYDAYKAALANVDPAAAPKPISEFQSSQQFKQEFELVNARSTAKAMGIAPSQTQGKTKAQLDQMMDTQSKTIMQTRLSKIDPKGTDSQLSLTVQEEAALRFRAENGDGQALSMLIAAGKTDEASKILADHPELGINNPEIVEYLNNVKAGKVRNDEQADFIKAIRTGKQKEIAGNINNLIKEGQTPILGNIGKKGTRYEGWQTVNSWTDPADSTKSLALIKNPKTNEYFIVNQDSTQRNEEIYKIPSGQFTDADGRQQEYASPYVYYNAYREGTSLTPTPNEQTGANRVSNLKLIQYGNELYNGKVEDNREIGFVASIGDEDSDVAVFMNTDEKRFEGASVKENLDPFTETAGIDVGVIKGLGEYIYVNNDGAVYNRDQRAVESSLLAPDSNRDGRVTSQDNIALANYNIDLGRNVRLYSTVGTDAQGKDVYRYWACYEVRGQQACEETDLTSFVPKEFAAGKKGRDLERQIQNRQRFQRFVGTLINGPTGPGKYYSQKFNNWTYTMVPEWKEEIDRWMEMEWFRPEEWERLICKSVLDDDMPEDVQIGFDTAGNQIVTRRLQAERELMPDGSTLYQFNWLVRATDTNVLYTICVNTPYCDSNCLVLEGYTDVAVPQGSSSSGYVPIYGPTGVDYVSICFREAILDDKGEPTEEFGPMWAFAQPIVEENYLPRDVASTSGYNPGGSAGASTTIPSGAGTFGYNTTG
ncbi:hypothetical protein KY335_03860 [Candidatus Woesearchaeota archaeon]|nr:hypothetical protein [Candidatus Woesearchaeota archaeon]